MVRAFLVGAGATKAQYPEAPLIDDFFPILNTIRPDLFSSFQEIIGTGFENNYNVETAMELSDTFESSMKRRYLECIHYSIYSLIAKHTMSIPEQMNAYLTPQHPLRNTPPTIFRSLITDDRLFKEDFFMTLNYDLFLDREILRDKETIDYGFPKKDIQLGQQKLPLNFIKQYSVYHLHGSLNWQIAQDKIIINSAAVQPEYRAGVPNILLIPPGKKDIPDQISTLWSVVNDRIKEIDELIIIGCSLNPLDTELISLVKDIRKIIGAENIKVIYLDKPGSTGSHPVNEIKKYSKKIGGEVQGFAHGFSMRPSCHPEANVIEFIFK